MNKAIKKIGIILLIIILLPAIVFSVYELSTLSRSEKVLGEIYKNQLEAILFSVNQYSQDVASSWAGQFNSIITEEQKNPDEMTIKLDSLIKNIPTINSVFILKDKTKELTYYPSTGKPDIKEIQNVLKINRDKINRLFRYEKSGYRKIEPLIDTSSSGNILFVFVLNNLNLCGIIFNPAEFINNILSTKISLIAGNEFNIAIFNEKTNKQFLSDSLSFNDVQQKRQLWLLPNYYLGISLKGNSIESIVKQRTVTNLILIGALIIILIIGVWLVFKNIKREVELAQIKSDFVSNVSHELRTPLALISMFAETLEMGRVKNDQKKQEYYTIISQETNRLSRIVNKILSFSKMEAGKRTYNFEQTDLNGIVNKVYETYKFHLENNGFKFNFIAGKDIPKLKADPEAISEAVINLIDNAVKYSDQNKEITISTGREKENIYIEVKDNGIGISFDDQKKIFDKFYRVSAGLVHNSKGTGLGLTLVKHIMDAHKGKIELKSEPGKGSSFKLVFPTHSVL